MFGIFSLVLISVTLFTLVCGKAFSNYAYKYRCSNAYKHKGKYLATHSVLSKRSLFWLLMLWKTCITACNPSFCVCLFFLCIFLHCATLHPFTNFYQVKSLCIWQSVSDLLIMMKRDHSPNFCQKILNFLFGYNYKGQFIWCCH